MSEEQKSPHRETTYYVNDEPETTHEHALTVRAILTSAGFTPAEEYVLSSIKPPKEYRNDYDELVDIHEGEHFNAQFKGPTPTS
jgi:hypothetical protein